MAVAALVERTFLTKGRNQDLGTASNAGCHSRILNHSFTADAAVAENMKCYNIRNRQTYFAGIV